MVRKEGKYWRVQITRGGVRHSTTFSTKIEAESYKAQVIADWKRKRTNTAANYTVEDALTRWAREELPNLKSRQSTANHAKQLLPFVDGVALEDISEVWAAYKKANSHLKPATLNRKGAILRRVANLAQKNWGWTDKAPHIDLLPENNQRHLYISKEELNLLVDNCWCQETQSLLRILFYTGMRISEALVVSVTDKGLFLPSSKNGTPRLIPIHREIAEDVKIIPFKFAYGYYYDRFVEARKRIGRDDLHIHDIRHSTASALLASGADLVTVRDVLGHKSILTTNRYSHVASARLKSAIDKL